MDRKTVIVLVASFALLFVWQLIVPKIFPPIPVVRTNFAATATNVLLTNAATATISSNTASAATPIAAVPLVTPAITIATNSPEQTETIETADRIITFTSHGGGVKRVELKQYHETVGCEQTQGTNLYATLNDHASVPILAVQADGAFGDNIFKLSRVRTNSVVAEKVLPSGLRVVKQFDVGPDYQIPAKVRFENSSGQEIVLPAQQVSVGTATPMGPRDDTPTTIGVFWFNGEKAEHTDRTWFDPAGGCMGMGSRPPRLEYSSGPHKVSWAAVHNQFFAIALVTTTNSLGGQFTTHRIDLPPPTAAEIMADPKVIRTPHGLEATISYPAVTLAANQSLERQYTIYAGPKQEKLLAHLGRGTDEIMDFGFWSPISKVMLRMMNLIHRVIAPITPEVLGKYAMSLVLMTIIIKLVFWPLTQKSTRSMKRMQALAPEMNKLKEKYKDDPMKLNKKTMEFWREHKVSPMSGCWPMMIQLPIFFALFRMIPNAIELRGTRFLWACDLSKPDTILMLPGLGFPFNPLPLVMGVTMLIQARMQPPSPGMDPAQQKMMKYMPLMFLVFLYNQPAGLTLYWTVQNLLTIVQTKLTKAKEEPATAPGVAVIPPRKKK
jgi:YidC/Oxa1 family membrane protein insertase